ncbi:hypothetical protein BOX15_Mlig022696g1 [Macrostomum lignano]|uniref:Potassium channel tetramerisation-type BTB domain-containing protein n=1 Tax=Macrostomum lignano TaxID=282301 RepID=A0A267FZZ4_9PLAT|nr:hypothetical protein BOX15_Mlig022696g1 [Macrostomum lignano]
MEASEQAVVLNVGGIVHTTTRATLCKFPGSMLAVMFGGSFTPSVLRDPAGHVFIDRDGRLFRHVLNYLRCSRLCLPDGFQVGWTAVVGSTYHR